MNFFPVGNWNHDLEIANFTEQDLDDWLFCGQTLPMSPNFSINKPEDVEKIRHFLDRFHAAGFQVLLKEQDLSFKKALAQDLDAYRAHFEKICERLGDHPGLYGFYSGDEPDDKNLQQSIDVVRIQQAVAPKLTTWINHHPWYSNWEHLIRQFTGFGYLENFLDWYVAESGIRMLSYDCYAHLLPEGDHGNKAGLDQYFQNLNGFYAGAKKHNIPMWVFQLASGHMEYRCPNEDEFRWQVSTAVAHGARGLLWFVLHMGSALDGYRQVPIDETGIRTERFNWLALVMKKFHASVGPILMKLTLEQVQHVNTAYGDTAPFSGKGLVTHASGWPSQNLIVSEFRHEDGSPYVMVTNNSMTESSRFTIQIRGQNPALHLLCPTGSESLNNHCEQGRDYARASRNLTPGALALYRVAMVD